MNKVILFLKSKPFVILLIVFFIVFGSFASIGFSNWIFESETTDTKDNIGLDSDPIRENATFNDGFDVVDRGIQTYDVYFMAQSVPYTTLFGNGFNQTGNNQIVQPYYTCMNYGSVYGYNINYGHFAQFDNVTNYESNNFNQYFLKFENRAEISVSDLDNIPNPINKLVDGNNWPSDGTGLRFAGWMVYPYDIYFKESGSHSLNQVYGWYPFDILSSDSSIPAFELFNSNALLSTYDNIAINVNGKKSLFLFPLFTTNKNYYEQRNQNPQNVRDSISIQKKDSNDKNLGENYFIYNSNLSKGLRTELGLETSDTSVNVFQINNYTIDSKNDYNNPNIRIDIINDMDRNDGSWEGNGNFDPYRGKHYVQNTDTFGDNFDLKKSSGRFNIYLIIKEAYDSNTGTYRLLGSPNFDYNFDFRNNTFSDTEIQNIDNFFSSKNIGKYISYDLGTYESRHEKSGIYQVTHNRWYTYGDTRDYYIYYERLYEPRLIGGETNELNYDSEHSISDHFVRQGIEGNLKDRYELTGVNLDGSATIELSISNERTMLIPNYYFGVQLTPENFFTTYTFAFKDESQNQTPEWPKLKLENDDEVIEQPFSSSSMFRIYDPGIDHDIYIRESNGEVKTLQEANYDFDANPIELIKPINKGNDAIGIYTITVDVEYGEDGSGRTVPKTIYIYGYRLSNIFVNICDDETFKTGLSLGGDRNNNFVDTSSYSYRKDNYYQLQTLTLEDRFTDTNNSNEITLGEILTNLSSQNKCLQELVTHRYITYESLDPNNSEYDPFVIRKNYVFMIVDKPTAN